jgi:hypothetical protein
LNRRPLDCQSSVLPAELHPHTGIYDTVKGMIKKVNFYMLLINIIPGYFPEYEDKGQILAPQSLLYSFTFKFPDHIGSDPPGGF